MGIRKHGVGEILSEENELTKQASSQPDWSEQDERDLAEEDSE